MASPYKAMSNKELREKLLEYGYDIPVSVNKDFMIKKLEGAIRDRAGNGTATATTSSRTSTSSATAQGRKSLGAANRRKAAPAPSPPSTDTTTDDDEPQQYFASTSTTNTTSFAKGRPSQTCSTNSTDNSSDRGSTTYSSARRTTRGSISSPAVNARRVTPEPLADTRASTTPVIRKPAVKRARPSEHIVDEPTPTLSNERYSNPTNLNMETEPSFTSLSQKRNNSPLASNKFGLIISGRMVKTEFIPNEVINPKKFVIEIPDAETVDYLAVFLTGKDSFPPGTAGQIYLGWPNSQNDVSWHLLGHISNLRPSGFFNITELRKGITSNSNERQPHNVSFGSCERSPDSSNHVVAQIGISIEPLELVLSSVTQKLQL